MLSSFYPVVAGRISDASTRHRSLYQVQVGRIAIQDLERQLSTGERFAKPSDDPTAALRVIGLQRELEFREQTSRNLDSAQGYLNTTESVLGNVQDLVTDLRGLGLEATTNLANDADRAGWINQIDAGIQRLASAANTKYLDRFLFTGGMVQTPTVAQRSSSVLFQGNQLNLQSIADNQDYISHNVTGLRAFGMIAEDVEGTTPLNPNAVGTTRLSDLNAGRGVSAGAIQFASGTETVTVDLANAETVQDVVDQINRSVVLDGRTVQATVLNGSLQLNYADNLPGTLRISEVGTSRTAGDLGIATNVPAPALPVVGGALSPVVRNTTLLTQLNGGTGFDWSSGLRIKQGNSDTTVNFNGAQTVEDVINRINRSGAAVMADISPDGSSLRIRSISSGEDFSITESTGTLAQALGLRTFTGQTRLADLNYGRGVQFGPTSDLEIRRNDGTTFRVDLEGSVTVQDVINRINGHADNQVTNTRVLAGLRATENGIQLTSPIPTPPPDPVPIQVTAVGGSQAAWDLGLIRKGETLSTGVISGGDTAVFGADPNPQEVRGMFNSLHRMREAIRSKDSAEVARAIELLDEDLSRLSLTRGSLGVEQQRIEDLKEQQELTKIELQADKSRTFESDMASVISELNARQIAYEASLKLLANAGQTSLFNYL